MPSSRLTVVMLLPLLLLAVGTVGYSLIEGWAPLDALYMTVITVSTVGFREVGVLSVAGRGFTIALILGGVVTITYAGSEIMRAILEGEFRQMFGRQRMQRSLAEMEEHFIVCGLGRMGQHVCQEFSSLGLRYVVIERRQEMTRGFSMPHGIVVEGDATSDEVLRRAGVERARGLVTVAASDADNLYITMSARLLNPGLHIVARAESEAAAPKLMRSGANRVVTPYVLGGHRVAQAVLRPSVVDFIELATRSEHLELQMEEVTIRPGSSLVGRDLKGSQIRQDLGIIIVAIKTSGRMRFNPAPDVVMNDGDVLIGLGNRQQLDRLDVLARQPRS